MKIIKWGIIGAGNISKQFVTALTQMKDTEVVGVAARDSRRARIFAEIFQIPKFYGSYEELVKEDDIDVIYVGTPHTLHMEHAILCMTHGKAVLCEKPLGLNCNQIERMSQVAIENHVFFMEAMWTKFLPITKQVNDWISTGKIGRIQNMQINFGFQSQYERDGRLYNLDLAGGALLDVGIYPITYASMIMGAMPDSIVSSAVIGDTGVDIQNTAILNYGTVIATLGSSIVCNMGKDAIIIGTSGRIIVPDFWCATRAYLFDHDNVQVDARHIPHQINGYEYEAYEVNDCMRRERYESDIVPLRDTTDIMKIMDSMRAAWHLVYPAEL